MVYVFLANGFEEVEAMSVIDILRRAGQEVLTIGVGGQKVTSAHAVTVETDLSGYDMDLVKNPPDMIVLPGGMPGTTNLENSHTVHSAIDWCAENGNYLAAICAAPSILGHCGLLRGGRAVCYPGYEKDLDCEIGTEPVVQWDRIITARGAGVAVDFALKLVEVLCGKEKSQEIRKSIQCV
ncbi:MAG: DJ-1/PfpI family protein [Oscillospiraceae bacterium]|jgi:4-methyl-5(b-hydroxyethyl)-thiazole monophosphate biosynthesis|nr:DJ-1/PfpI family protein [Oscillospiraceae bacterium]MDD3260708.1 DJ-1/PfpI family protein [Oscillospiraceae bacterium]